MKKFDKNLVNEIFLELNEQIISELKIEVLDIFLRQAFLKFRSMEIDHILNEKVLVGLFESSTFYELIEDSPEYVMDFNSLYWSQNILDEIDNTIDLKKLSYAEKLNSIGAFNTFEVEADDSLIYTGHITWYSEQPRIKHKNEYLKKIGLQSTPVQSKELESILKRVLIVTHFPESDMEKGEVESNYRYDNSSVFIDSCYSIDSEEVLAY